MREIDNAEVGRDAVHDALAERDRIVHDAEIGHEDDGWRRFDGRLLRQERAGDEEVDEQRTINRIFAPILLPGLMSSA